MSRTEESLVVCEQCGLAHRWHPVRPRQVARCDRCEAVLGRGRRLHLEAVLALTVTAAILFLIGISTGVLTLRLRGGTESTTLPGAILVAWQDGRPIVATVAAVTALIAPAVFIALRLYVLTPLAVGRVPPGFAWCVRLLHLASRWSMIEVFMIGGLLSLVRLSAMADATPGPGLFALGATTLLFAAIESAGLKHLWWRLPATPLGPADRPGDAATATPELSGPDPASTAAAAAAPLLLGCESCGLVSANVLGAGAAGLEQHCPRCDHALRLAKPLSLQRTWAFAIAAAVFYVPANTLPIMVTTSAFDRQEHTLLGGIHELWVDGSWALSIIVFIASIAVPVLKVGALGLLAWSVKRASRWRRLERARLYRLIELVGHWSMLDVYVVVLLAATVRFGPLASVDAGPALLAFTAVVVLSMLATHSFDPKLIWRDAEPDAGSPPLPFPLPSHERQPA